MSKILTTTIFGLICFGAGVLTQYLLPVNSSNLDKLEKLEDCEEIRLTQDKTEKSPEETTNLAEENDEQLTDTEIREYAQKITVKVFAGQNSGSGILFKRSGNTYQVITNNHVLLFGKQNQSYRIKTPDGQVYPATMTNNYNFGPQDLGVLKFVSEAEYEVVNLSSVAIPPIGEPVFAAGFPYQSDFQAEDQLTFNTGVVDSISDKSFRGGYRIGYSNDIVQGMSGGPLFNSQGQVIGINGRHKYPVWGNPYIFEDGTVASPSQKEEMSKSSWAIPIQTFLKSVPNMANFPKNN